MISWWLRRKTNHHKTIPHPQRKRWIHTFPMGICTKWNDSFLKRASFVCNCCSFGHFCPNWLQILLKFSQYSEWVLDYFPTNGCTCSFTWFTRTSCSKQMSHLAMLLLFLNVGSNRTDGNIEQTRDLLISNSSIMIFHYNTTNFLKKKSSAFVIVKKNLNNPTRKSSYLPHPTMLHRVGLMLGSSQEKRPAGTVPKIVMLR